MNNTIPFNPTSRTVCTEQITVDVSILSVLNYNLQYKCLSGQSAM